MDKTSMLVAVVTALMGLTNVGVSMTTLQTRERLVAVETSMESVKNDITALQHSEQRIVAEIRANDKSSSDRYMDLIKEIKAIN